MFRAVLARYDGRAMDQVKVAIAEDNVLLREVPLLTARESQILAEMAQEHLAADTLMRLWDARDCGTFVSC
jgi:hypothetical protein